MAFRIRHGESSYLKSISYRNISFRRGYKSMLVNINTPKVRTHELTKEELRKSKELAFNPILKYINDNYAKSYSLRPRIENLRKFLGDYELNDEVLSMVLHPFDEQHFKIKVEVSEDLLVDADSTEMIGKNLIDLEVSLFLVDTFTKEYGVDILSNRVNRDFHLNSSLNHFLIQNTLLRIPKSAPHYFKHLHIVRSRRVFHRIVGFINVVHGKTKASEFINTRFIKGEGGLFKYILSKRGIQ